MQGRTLPDEIPEGSGLQNFLLSVQIFRLQAILPLQEFFGLLMAHFAIRGLMHEAALQAGEDPDRLSFLHAVRVVQRKMTRSGAIPPSEQESSRRPA